MKKAQTSAPYKTRGRNWSKTWVGDACFNVGTRHDLDSSASLKHVVQQCTIFLVKIKRPKKIGGNEERMFKRLQHVYPPGGVKGFMRVMSREENHARDQWLWYCALHSAWTTPQMAMIIEWPDLKPCCWGKIPSAETIIFVRRVRSIFSRTLEGSGRIIWPQDHILPWETRILVSSAYYILTPIYLNFCITNAYWDIF